MKGFAMLGIGKVGFIEKDKPVAGAFDAIVKPIAVSPCTSDIHTVYDGALGERTDMILGHEAVGEVVEVGSEVKDFKPGDRVVVPAITPDWRSKAVVEGNPQHSNGMLAGWKFSNFKDGVFGEYFHVNDADMNLAIMPDSIDPGTAVMACDMMTTGFHGAELADIQIGDTVVCIGIGAVGLMAVAGAKLRGAGRIIAIGNRPVTVEAAKFYGATDIVDYKDGDTVDQVKDLLNGSGADSVIISGGNADILDSAVKMTRPGGVVSNINYFGSGDTIGIPRLDWGNGMAHIDIRGGLCPGGRYRMERLISMIENGRVDPSKLITHTFNGYDKLEEALELMRDKPADLIKPVVILG